MMTKQKKLMSEWKEGERFISTKSAITCYSSRFVFKSSSVVLAHIVSVCVYLVLIMGDFLDILVVHMFPPSKRDEDIRLLLPVIIIYYFCFEKKERQILFKERHFMFITHSETPNTDA